MNEKAKGNITHGDIMLSCRTFFTSEYRFRLSSIRTCPSTPILWINYNTFHWRWVWRRSKSYYGYHYTNNNGYYHFKCILASSFSWLLLVVNPVVYCMLEYIFHWANHERKGERVNYYLKNSIMLCGVPDESLCKRTKKLWKSINFFFFKKIYFILV